MSESQSSVWPIGGIVYNAPNVSPLDADLLAWAKRKAKEPFEWCHDHVRCAFCGQQQALMWNGVMAAHHTDTCLAKRVNTEGVV